MILGLDLSLRGSGLALVPLDWAPGLDFARVRVQTVGQSLSADATPRQQAERIAKIANAIVVFARNNGVTKAWIENYAFSRGDSRAHALGELGGVVRVALLKSGIPFDVVHSNTARAHLGKFAARPKKKSENRNVENLPPKMKVQVQLALHAMGAPKHWTGDELDAFVVANHGLIEGGHGGIVVAQEQKAKREKKAKAA